MSSTNRGGVREVSDYYYTPALAVDQFLAALTEDAPAELGCDLTAGDLCVLDPASGGDADNGMAYPDAIRRFGKWDAQILTTIDTRDDSKAENKGDFLTMDLSRSAMFPWDVCCTNPPFALALGFIKKGLLVVRPGGIVAMLLRLNFFETEERKAWLQANMPALCYVHSKRMAFRSHIKSETPEFLAWLAKQPATSNRKALFDKWRNTTDSIAYMHAVWQRDVHPKFTKLRVI